VSIHDQRELRDRLGSLLYGVEPGPPPVVGTMRRGREIRMRRWISVAAGVAVLAAGAVVLPGVLRAHLASPIAPLDHSVIVSPIGAGARAGLIGQGTTDGRRWTVVMSPQGKGVTLTGRGLPGAQPYYQDIASQFTASPAALTTTGSGPTVLEFGTVRADVTHVVISLPAGEVVSLTPVSWHGRSWVAVLLPARVPIVRAVLYTSRGELAYAVPFGDTQLDVWWQPGQVGPARLTKSIGSGVVDGERWRAAADIGPWGYCYSVSSASTCIDSTVSPVLLAAGALVSPMICGSLDAPGAGAARVGFGAAAAAVRRVVLEYSGGGTADFSTVAVGRGRMFGYAIPGGHKVAGSREYGAAGQLLGSTSGAAWEC
jgi:hypothetical protein